MTVGWRRTFFGATATFWMTPALGIRAHGAYLPMRLPNREGAFDNAGERRGLASSSAVAASMGAIRRRWPSVMKSDSTMCPARRSVCRSHGSRRLRQQFRRKPARSRKRLLRMGEDERFVFNVGSPAWSDRYQGLEWPWLNGLVDAMVRSDIADLHRGYAMVIPGLVMTHIMGLPDDTPAKFSEWSEDGTMLKRPCSPDVGVGNHGLQNLFAEQLAQ